ncbi:MAG: methyl-accepting chemotaxis protein [Candidatus Gorgyraea atricola]|nr:methyl-accepting chemotaxis protein [Candidatus Gorgyraea atricola]
METKQIFRRRQYLIKRGLQFRYIGLVFALVIMCSLVTGYTVFTTGWVLLGEKLSSVYPQGRLVYVFRATNLALIRNLFLVSPLVFIIALFSSHKIAGPVYRIEKTLEEINNGNLALKIKFRRGDELWDLADLINTMIENFNKTIASSKDAGKDTRASLEAMKKEISGGSCDCAKIKTSLSELQAKIDQVNSSLDQWTT